MHIHNRSLSLYIYIHTIHRYVYIYIYIEREREREKCSLLDLLFPPHESATLVQSLSGRGERVGPEEGRTGCRGEELCSILLYSMLLYYIYHTI